MVTLLNPSPDPSAPFPDVLGAVTSRWRRYSAQKIDYQISPHDDMFFDNREHYAMCGVSALEAITEGMVLARLTAFDRILDLPCGGGRATRHLVKFFPDSEVWVSDLEKPKETFVVERFGVRAAPASLDFSTPSPQTYDLIFIGSLITHFSEAMFRRTIDYCMHALNPSGLLIASTHGRFAAAAAVEMTGSDSQAREDFFAKGFGYHDYPALKDRYTMSYGGSFSTPAWLTGVLQDRPDTLILGYKEKGWSRHHDVFVAQKL